MNFRGTNSKSPSENFIKQFLLLFWGQFCLGLAQSSRWWCTYTFMIIFETVFIILWKQGLSADVSWDWLGKVWWEDLVFIKWRSCKWNLLISIFWDSNNFCKAFAQVHKCRSNHESQKKSISNITFYFSAKYLVQCHMSNKSQMLDFLSAFTPRFLLYVLVLLYVLFDFFADWINYKYWTISIKIHRTVFFTTILFILLYVLYGKLPYIYKYKYWLI